MLEIKGYNQRSKHSVIMQEGKGTSLPDKVRELSRVIEPRRRAADRSILNKEYKPIVQHEPKDHSKKGKISEN